MESNFSPAALENFSMAWLNFTDSPASLVNNSEVWEFKPILGYFYLMFSSMDTLAVFINNAFIILIMSKDDRLCTTSNLLIGNLAAADLLWIFVWPEEIIIYVPVADHMKIIACSMFVFLFGLVIELNVGIHLLMALDRYIYIAHGIRYHTLLTERRIKISILTLWICVFIYQIYIAIQLHGYIKFELGECQTGLEKVSGPVLLMATFISISTLAIIGIYAKIAHIAVRQNHSINPVQPAPLHSYKFKVAKTLALVSGLYTCCNIQMVVFMSILGQQANGDLQFIAKHVVFLVWRVNLWINPLIYAWMSKDFRKGIKKFIQSLHRN